MTVATVTKPDVRKPLVVNFKEDTLTTVSRATVRTLSDRLGFNDTQTVLYALARLRDEVIVAEVDSDDFKPLTKKQHAVIAHAEPKTRGRVIGTALSNIGWKPWPELADIVDCRFPEGSFPEGFEMPGPKVRPVLVLSIEESTSDPESCVVVVAYATSQNIAKVYPGEFVIMADALNGLVKTTKFDLVNRHRLPFDNKWFGPAPGSNPQHPKRGRLDINDIDIKRTLVAAISVAEDLRKHEEACRR